MCIDLQPGSDGHGLMNEERVSKCRIVSSSSESLDLELAYLPTLATLPKVPMIGTHGPHPSHMM